MFGREVRGLSPRNAILSHVSGEGRPQVEVNDPQRRNRVVVGPEPAVDLAATTEGPDLLLANEPSALWVDHTGVLVPRRATGARRRAPSDDASATG
jgi:hypothetical protein